MDSLSVGDRITVDRAVLTGQVVDASIPNWRSEPKNAWDLLWLSVLVGGLFALTSAIRWTWFRYWPYVSAKERRRHLAIVAALVLGIVSVLTFDAVHMHSNARLGGPGADRELCCS